MAMKLWMLDIAREQCPTLDHLYQYATLTQEAGYDAIGLYLEHRYAYRATPWAHGKGCVTESMIRSLQSEFPSLKIIPFINLLGHVEGFLYTEEGKQYREELFAGLQACPSNENFVRLCEEIIDETIEVFRSDIIHIGGDETNQLNACNLCQEVTAGQENPKTFLYGKHFGPLAQRVVDRGRRPAVWGDMFLEHPAALQSLPPSTLI
nr:family 20 glycosylhydrolase [Fimbriimonadaceae bacterium]